MYFSNGPIKSKLNTLLIPFIFEFMTTLVFLAAPSIEIILFTLYLAVLSLLKSNVK